MRARFSVLGLVAGLSLSACGGPSFDGRVYRSKDMSFRVGPLPETWREIQVDGALLAFRDDPEQGTVAVNGRCGVDGDDVPLAALTHHLFLHFTRRDVKEQASVALDGREALRTEIEADLDGVRRRFVVYVLKKDGCVYDFMWIGPNPEPASASFERFVRGFTTEI